MQLGLLARLSLLEYCGQRETELLPRGFDLCEKQEQLILRNRHPENCWFGLSRKHHTNLQPEPSRGSEDVIDACRMVDRDDAGRIRHSLTLPEIDQNAFALSLFSFSTHWMCITDQNVTRTYPELRLEAFAMTMISSTPFLKIACVFFDHA